MSTTLGCEMGGLFVDKDHCLHVVIARVDATQTVSVVVHGSTYAEESTCNEWTGAVTTDDDDGEGLVLSVAGRPARRGAWDGRDELSWDNGDVWQRLRVSEPQWRILSGRPYVSGLFVILALSCYAVATVYKWCCYVSRRASQVLGHGGGKSPDGWK